MSQTMPPPVFDPFAPGFTDDPYPQYAALRSGAPAGRHPLGFFLLTRYDDVSGLLRAAMSVEDGNITDRQLIELREQMYGEEAYRPRGISMLSRTSPVCGSTRRKSLSSPSQVACHSSPSTHVTPVTNRFDSIVRRIFPVSGSI